MNYFFISNLPPAHEQHNYETDKNLKELGFYFKGAKQLGVVMNLYVLMYECICINSPNLH